MRNDQSLENSLGQNRRAFSSKVSPTETPKRVDIYLSRQFGYFSRRRWQQVIKSGRVMINAKLVSPATVVRPGDEILYTPAAQDEPAIDRDFDVLYEDDHVLVINKPAPCPTTQCGGYLYNTLDHLMGDYLRGISGQDYWVMHRLDMETSGALLIAKSKESQYGLYEQFETRRIQKTYVALTRQLTRNESGCTPLINHFQELPLGDDEESIIRIKSGVRFDPPFKSALTYFHVVSWVEPYALIRCRLYTGRTNQIRIHLTGAGHWIVGDKLYYEDEHVFDRYTRGKLSDADTQKLESPRMLLHAYEVRFTHPLTSEPLMIQAPLRKDMQAFAINHGLSFPLCHPRESGDPY